MQQTTFKALIHTYMQDSVVKLVERLCQWIKLQPSRHTTFKQRRINVDVMS